MSKSATAFRTISEVADLLDVPKHVLRFWELKFPQIKPMKRGGGRRYYRPEDLELLLGIKYLLHAEGYTIKGVQKILREQGVEAVKSAPPNTDTSNSIQADSKEQAPKARSAKKTAAKSKTVRSKKVAASKVKSLENSAEAEGLSQRATQAVHQAIKELEQCREALVAAQHSKKVAGKATGVTRKKQATKSARA